MNSVRLMLAGTIHKDPAGADRLWKFLDDRRPSGLTLEMSLYSLRFRREHRERLASELEANVQKLGPKAAASAHVREIRRAIELPYEYEVCESYARRRDIPLELVDIAKVSRDYLAHYDELVSADNLKKLLAAPEPDAAAEADRQRRIAKRLLAAAKPLGKKDWPVPPDPDTEEREAAMERRIKRVLEKAAGSHWIHVGGWEHLLWLEDRQSLYARLKSLAPDRVVV